MGGQPETELEIVGWGRQNRGKTKPKRMGEGGGGERQRPNESNGHGVCHSIAPQGNAADLTGSEAP